MQRRVAVSDDGADVAHPFPDCRVHPLHALQRETEGRVDEVGEGPGDPVVAEHPGNGNGDADE